MENTSMQSGFTVVIEMTNSHNQIILNDVKLRKTHGATSLKFEVMINGKFLLLKGKLMKGESSNILHIDSDVNGHLIKEILS